MLDLYHYVKNDKNSDGVADSYDTYIGSEKNFPYANGNAVYGSVNKRVWNDDGQDVGVVIWNLFIDTSKYEVDYLDGYIEEMTTKQIAKNILSQIDS